MKIYKVFGPSGVQHIEATHRLAALAKAVGPEAADIPVEVCGECFVMGDYSTLATEDEHVQAQCILSQHSFSGRLVRSDKFTADVCDGFVTWRVNIFQSGWKIVKQDGSILGDQGPLDGFKLIQPYPVG